MSVTSFDVECPYLGDFDFGLSSPVVTSTKLSSGLSGCISSSLLPMPIGQKFVGDLFRSAFRSSLMKRLVCQLTLVAQTSLTHKVEHMILDLNVIEDMPVARN